MQGSLFFVLDNRSYEVRFPDIGAPDSYTIHDTQNGFITSLDPGDRAHVNSLISILQNAGSSNILANLVATSGAIAGFNNNWLTQVGEYSNDKIRGDTGFSDEFYNAVKEAFLPVAIGVVSAPARTVQNVVIAGGALDVLANVAIEASRETVITGTHRAVVDMIAAARSEDGPYLPFVQESLSGLIGVQGATFDLDNTHLLREGLLHARLFQSAINTMFSAARELETGVSDFIPDDLAAIASAVASWYNPLVGLGVSLVNVVDNLIQDGRNLLQITSGHQTAITAVNAYRDELNRLEAVMTQLQDPERLQNAITEASEQTVIGTDTGDVILMTAAYPQVMGGNGADTIHFNSLNFTDQETIIVDGGDGHDTVNLLFLNSEDSSMDNSGGVVRVSQAGSATTTLELRNIEQINFGDGPVLFSDIVGPRVLAVDTVQRDGEYRKVVFALNDDGVLVRNVREPNDLQTNNSNWDWKLLENGRISAHSDRRGNSQVQAIDYDPDDFSVVFSGEIEPGSREDLAVRSAWAVLPHGPSHYGTGTTRSITNNDGASFGWTNMYSIERAGTAGETWGHRQIEYADGLVSDAFFQLRYLPEAFTTFRFLTETFVAEREIRLSGNTGLNSFELTDDGQIIFEGWVNGAEGIYYVDQTTEAPVMISSHTIGLKDVTGTLSQLIPALQAVSIAADRFETDTNLNWTDGSVSSERLDDGTATGDGNDTIHGSSSGVFYDGGEGLDTIIYAADRNDISFVRADGSLLFRIGTDGIDTLSSFERIQLQDGTLAFDLTGAAGQTFRLYRAAFSREPDEAGLAHNVNIMDGGFSIFDMAAAFIASAEFQQTYGVNVTDTVFLTLLYNNVLSRAPDDAGLAGWLAQLSSGEQSRQQVLFGFSESAENKAATASLTDDGIWLG